MVCLLTTFLLVLRVALLSLVLGRLLDWWRLYPDSFDPLCLRSTTLEFVWNRCWVDMGSASRVVDPRYTSIVLFGSVSWLIAYELASCVLIDKSTIAIDGYALDTCFADFRPFLTILC